MQQHTALTRRQNITGWESGLSNKTLSSRTVLRNHGVCLFESSPYQNLSEIGGLIVDTAVLLHMFANGKH